MRPVAKGNAPRAYNDYEDAFDDLVAAIGDYCSYCERQIETHLAVEHVRPKSRRKSLRKSWQNFLLGCANCNSCKGTKRVNLDRFFWPDRDNTLRAFTYVMGGRVIPNTGLSPLNQMQARRTIELVGLDKEPGHADRKKRPTSSDKRWRRRQEAWDLAQRDLTRLQTLDTSIVRELIVENALGRGVFSIWMTVFAQDADMRLRLVAGFRGTAANCFHPATAAVIARPGGQI
jgi:uncharacterized protein (TIGR02646 family)